MVQTSRSLLRMGAHALDYCRYMRLDMIRAQVSITQNSTKRLYLLHSTSPCPTCDDDDDVPIRSDFLYYEGGYLGELSYIDMNGERVFTAEDLWFEEDRVFVEAIRTGDGSGISDGLYTLAPLLAGWESARRDGEPVDVPTFMRR